MRALPPLLLSAALSACGARSELTLPAADASLPAADASLPAACAWSSSAPLAITLGDRDRSPLAARVLDDLLWVGFQSSNPDPPGNLGRFVRRTDALGRPVADATQVIPSPGELTTYGPLSLWTDPATRLHAAMSWTAGPGCVAVSLDDDARPSGAAVRLGSVDCAGVTRTARGWTFLTRGASSRFTRVHAADARGNETATVALAPDSPSLTASSRAVMNDEGFLFAWSERGTGRFTVTAHAAEGAMRAAPSTFTTRTPTGSVPALRIVPDGDTALVAWVELSEGERVGLISVARVGRDGALRVGPLLVRSMSTPNGRPLELGLAVARGAVGVVWNPSDSSDDGALHLVTLDPLTLRPNGAAVVQTARFVRDLSLHGTSQGFVAVFGAIAPPALTQVWTAAFRCLVPG